MRNEFATPAILVVVLSLIGQTFADGGSEQFNDHRSSPEPFQLAGQCNGRGCDDLSCDVSACCRQAGASDDDGCGCEAGCCGCCGWCNLDEAWTLQSYENCHNITYGGWFQVGYHSDNTPLSINDYDLLAFNDLPGRGNLHQAWFYLEKEAQGDCCGWDWGFRFDVVYGTDAQKTQAYGGIGYDNDWDNGIYGWALPQAYIALDKGPLNIKVGHFFTLIGYEVVAAPDNFFYSHALTMFNSEPFTHTGVLAAYETRQGPTIYGGWTAGWDTGFETFNESSNFLGGVSAPLGENVTLTYMVTVGNMGRRGDGYTHSFVLDWEINDRWEYVFQSDFVALRAGAANAGLANDEGGVNQYLFYTVNDCLQLGARLEWWDTDRAGDPVADRYEFTFGVNVRPHANLVFRPEVRYDWGDSILVPNKPNGQVTTFGIDAIFTF